MRSMLTQVPMLTGYAGVQHVEVSVPFVAVLLDGDGKYYTTPKPIDDDTERRRHRARGPTLRSLVRFALASDSAEQMGKQLKRRFEGTAAPHRAGAEAERDRSLGEPVD